MFWGKKNLKEVKQWLPELTNDELLTIEEPQAKLLYDNARGVLKEIVDSMENITKKADAWFKYLFTVISAILGVYFYKDKSIDSTRVIASLVILVIPTCIYLRYFISSSEHIAIHNTPERMLTPVILEDLKTVYINESIHIQQYAIPKNIKQMQQKSKMLHRMIWSPIVVGLLVLVYLCLSFSWLIGFIATSSLFLIDILYPF